MNNESDLFQPLLNKHNFCCAVYAASDCVAHWIGNKELLDYQSLPKQFFGGEAEVAATFSYLSGTPQPQFFAQGRVRVVLGLLGENIVYGFFTNTDESPKEFHKRAKILRDEIRMHFPIR